MREKMCKERMLTSKKLRNIVGGGRETRIDERLIRGKGKMKIYSVEEIVTIMIGFEYIGFLR